MNRDKGTLSRRRRLLRKTGKEQEVWRGFGSRTFCAGLGEVRVGRFVRLSDRMHQPMARDFFVVDWPRVVRPPALEPGRDDVARDDERPEEASLRAFDWA